MKRPPLPSAEVLVLLFAGLAALALFAWPLGLLLRTAVMPEGVPSLAPLAGQLGRASTLRALLHSLDSAASSALLSLVLGTAVALLVGLTDLRGKGVFTFLLLIPMMIPPHVTAIAWIQAMGPSSPLLKTLGLAPPLGSTHPLYSRGGVILLLGLQHMPLVFLVVLAALRALPRDLAEAARIAGARPAMLLRRIVLPLLAPALIAAAALAFVSALGNFGIQALLGIPARYITLPVLIWQRLASFGPSVLSDVAVLAALLGAVAVAVLLLQSRLLRRAGSALAGRTQAPLRIALGRGRLPAEAALGLLVLGTLVLPFCALFATALVPTYGVALTRATLSWENFAEVLLRQEVTLRAFANSLGTAAAAAGACALGAVVLARHMASPARRIRQGGTAMAGLAETAYAIPGLVISVAFILAFLRPLPLLGLSLYNTLGIIFLAYLCAFFAIALKPVSAAVAQLDPALEEAARIAGAGYLLRLRRTVLPLIAPAAASGAILVFLTAYNEVTVSALLWSTGNETIGTVIYNYEDGGDTVLAAAMASVTVAATVALMGLLDLLGRRAPPGVVPWRF